MSKGTQPSSGLPAFATGLDKKHQWYKTRSRIVKGVRNFKGGVIESGL